ncbi:MAG: hypothetical protein Q7W05_03570 [Deltaproteobacteria bacterium]|nr:hypothetical protein [Deltaproteobacteria bacterium]
MSKIEDALAKASQLRQSKVDGNNHPEPSPSPPLAVDKGKKLRGYMIAIPLVLAIGVAIYQYVTPLQLNKQKVSATDISGKLRPVVQQSTNANLTPHKNRLPTIIPLDSPDSAYATANPGWQRYATKSLEFRVFREANTVKAVQVLAKHENAITADFFTSFLGEITEKDLFKVKSGEEKDGYYIEKGFTGEMTEVVVYRKKPAGEIRALVVAYL